MNLTPDCERCCALCCVAPFFEASEDFAYEKPAQEPCRHLLADHRCEIHADLAACGFRGCAAYDCSGAGQKVTQVTFKGRSWEELPEPRIMFDAFMIMRVLHELLVLLRGARRFEVDARLAADLESARFEIEKMTFLDAPALCDLDVEPMKRRCSHLLREVGAQQPAACQRSLPVLPSGPGQERS